MKGFSLSSVSEEGLLRESLRTGCGCGLVMRSGWGVASVATLLSVISRKGARIYGWRL